MLLNCVYVRSRDLCFHMYTLKLGLGLVGVRVRRKTFPQLGGPLTYRDAWAATFEHVLSLDTPRQDCPSTLPVVLPPPPGELERQPKRPVDEHAVGLMATLCQDLVRGWERQNAFARVQSRRACNVQTYPSGFCSLSQNTGKR